MHFLKSFLKEEYPIFRNAWRALGKDAIETYHNLPQNTNVQKTCVISRSLYRLRLCLCAARVVIYNAA